MKKNKINFLVLTVSVLVFWTSLSSAGVKDVFSGAMTSFNAPTKYEGNGRIGASFGSGVVRFPHKSIQLISLTPPSFSAGCNGISWSLGGFSFIDGEELMSFIQSAGNGALGQVVLLATKVICPPCAGTINDVEAMSRWMSKFSADSCQAGKDLANWGASKAMTTLVAGCESSEMNTNSVEDFYASQKANTCKPTEGRGRIAQNLVDTMEAEGWATQQNEIEASTSAVPLWNYLRKNKIIPNVPDGTKITDLSPEEVRQLGMAEILMSLYIPLIERDLEKMTVGDFEWNTVRIKSILDWFMCGWGLDKTLSTDGQTIQKSACQQKWKELKVFTIPTCGGSASGTINGETCNLEGKKMFGDSLKFAKVTLGVDDFKKWTGGVFMEKGVYSMTYKAFDLAFKNIKNNLSPDDSNPLLKQLVNFVPFDLYRVFNIASVAPKVARKLSKDMTSYIVYAFVDSFFRSTMGDFSMGKEDSSGKVMDDVDAVFSRILSSLSGKISEVSEYNKSPEFKGLKYQELFNGVIMSVEQDISREVSSRTIYQGAKFKTESDARTESNNKKVVIK
mgnify:CR=1 FL=1